MKKTFCILTILLLLPTCGGREKDNPQNAEVQRDALLQAVDNCNLDKVTELLAEGADVNCRTRSGTTLFERAMYGNWFDLAKLLLAGGAELSAKDADKWLARLFEQWDSGGGDEQLVILLLSHAADLDKKHENGTTALLWAVQNGHPEVVEYLLEHGADFRITDAQGMTALHRAAYGCLVSSSFDIERQSKAVELMIRGGADPDARDTKGMTPLHHAVQREYEKLADLLMAKGADPNPANDNGNTPLDTALVSGKPGIVLLVAGYGGRLSRNPENLVEAAMVGDTGGMKAFIAAGNKVDMKDKQDLTALHFAANNGNIKAAALLVENKADVNSWCCNLGTPLHVAALRDHRDVAEILISHNANVNGLHFIASPLYIAVEQGHKDIVELLAIKGADLNSGTEANWEYSRTPLQRAVELERREIAELLISRGCKINEKDACDRTALDLAKTAEMKLLLLKHGAKTGKELEEKDK